MKTVQLCNTLLAWQPYIADWASGVNLNFIKA